MMPQIVLQLGVQKASHIKERPMPVSNHCSMQALE